MKATSRMPKIGTQIVLLQPRGMFEKGTVGIIADKPYAKELQGKYVYVKIAGRYLFLHKTDFDKYIPKRVTNNG